MIEYSKGRKEYRTFSSNLLHKNTDESEPYQTRLDLNFQNDIYSIQLMCAPTISILK